MAKTVKQRLLENAAAFNDTAARVRGDRKISDYGKQLEIARAYSRARRRQRELMMEDEQTRISAVDRSARALFGAGHSDDAQTVIARRDALDRVEKLQTAGDGLRMLERAVNTGDGILARAVLARAWALAAPEGPGRDWSEVVEKFLGEYPTAIPAADQLVSAQNSGLTRGDRLEVGMAFGKPTELKGVSDVDVWLHMQGDRPDAPSTGAPPKPTESSNDLFRSTVGVSRANHETGYVNTAAANAHYGGDAA